MNAALPIEPDRPLLVSRRRTILLSVAVAGVAAFLVGLAVDPSRTWAALLVSFLFWSGLGHAGVVLSAIFQATSARWARPLKRLAEASVAFVPVSLLVMTVLLTGVTVWMPWVHEPVPGREAWLNVPFLVVRQTLGFVLLAGASLIYVRASIRPDLGMRREAGHPVSPAMTRWCLGAWRGLETERAASQRRQTLLAPVVLILYGCVLSLQAFDFVMSLDPEWFSTLIGGYVFIGNLYIGCAFLVMAVIWIGPRIVVDDRDMPRLLHDVGRMLLGFCMLWTYLFWSQYLVIWYGDLPEETAFVAHRTVDMPWAPVSWTVLVAAFVAPFIFLLSRELKRSPRGLLLVALVAAGAMWLERFVLVGPSLWHGGRLPLGPLEVLVTAGVGAASVYCYVALLERVPVVPVSDPLLPSGTSSV